MWVRLSLPRICRDPTPLQSCYWRKRAATILDSLGVGWILQLWKEKSLAGLWRTVNPDYDWPDIVPLL